MWSTYSFYEAFFQETIFPGGIFLDSKLRDKETHKIKIFNPKTSVKNKTSTSPVSSTFNA